MMDIICISTFNELGKLKGITLEKLYKVKWVIGDKFFIINDKGELSPYPILNFIKYKDTINKK